jgi:hypothetical protein
MKTAQLESMSVEDVALALVLKLRGGDPAIAHALVGYVEQSAPAAIARAVRPVIDQIAAQRPLPALPVHHIRWLCDVAAEIRAQGCAPSFADLAGRWGLSSASCAQFRVSRLREAGLVDWPEGKIRGLRVTREGRQFLKEVTDGHRS